MPSVVLGRGSYGVRGRDGGGFDIGICMAGVAVIIVVAMFVAMFVAMSVSMSVSIAVIVLVNEHSTDEVQGKADRSDYKN